MAARCHGICSRLPHEKVVRWLSTQLKKLFRFCRRCHLYIKHPVDELYCKCCGCRLRGMFKKLKKRDTRVHSRNYKAKNKAHISSYNKYYYRRNKASKQDYYRNNQQKVLERGRFYKLKTKLLKIFFITLYPHLLLDKDVVFN